MRTDNNNSSVKGVSYMGYGTRWKASININKVRTIIGYYNSREEAEEARLAYEIKNNIDRGPDSLLCEHEATKKVRGMCGACYEKWKVISFPEKAKVRNAKISRSNFRRKIERYGLSYDDYIEKLEKGCEICGEKLKFYGNRTNLHVDHDHNTGLFRGVLCQCCNTSIGKLGDSVEGLQRAIDYLNKSLI
jgi:hypothetical protein